MTVTHSSVTRAYVGASGFSYAEWKGSFYPADAKPADFLRLYAERLTAVELNNTFYRLPSEEQFRRWADATPPAFRFAVKTPMAITHFGRLDEVATLCERLGVLGGRLGPLLVRLPDTRPRDDGFLQLLLESVEPEMRVALDLRDPSWNGIESALPANAVRVNQLEAPAPFRYLRFSEPPYEHGELAEHAEAVKRLARTSEVYCLFSKGASAGHAPAGEPTAAAAERFLRLLR